MINDLNGNVERPAVVATRLMRMTRDDLRRPSRLLISDPALLGVRFYGPRPGSPHRFDRSGHMDTSLDKQPRRNHTRSAQTSPAMNQNCSTAIYCRMDQLA